jgi:hypothetical protein
MTDEEIKVIAQESGMEEFWGTRDDSTNYSYWEGWEDQMLRFARALLDPIGQPTREEN